MAKRKRRPLDTVILAILVAGAIVFALLLAGAGMGALTNPAPYIPPAPAATASP